MLTIPPRIQTITNFKQAGGKVAAVFPIHYPRALLRAFDILPVEVWGPPQVAPGGGATHLQAYVCSICHNGLAYLQQGGLEIADYIFVPHACDSLQGFGSLLLDYVVPSQPVIPIYIPRGERGSALEFLAAELRATYDRLVGLTGREPGQAALSASIDREEAADNLLLGLHRHNSHLPLTNYQIYKVIRSREYLPAEAFTSLVRGVLAQAQDDRRPGVPILIEGIVPEPTEIFEVLTGFGAAVVGDDLACCGRRVYPASSQRDPFERMADRILRAPPDPTRGSSIRERREHLLDLAVRTGAQGIIFYLVKFCEPELFDIPLLRQELRAAGLASILIEVDLNTQLTQQIRTRLEAFVEMIQ
jgi:benzoyl-CoA reductase/2-hydroxyglutaryl-CoA dehydratase subunit BcrC/BadD/HgdB